MNHDPRRPLVWASLVVIATALFVPASVAAKSLPTVGSGKDPLDYAFRFASAIVSDPKDMAKAQEAVVWDLSTLGRWNEAITAADRISGWRRGTAYADLAVALARAGRNDEARTLIAKAEEVRQGITGWQNPRISAHIANAWASVGEIDKAKTIATATTIEDAEQYRGRAVATVASGLGAKGSYDAADAELARLDSAQDLEDTWWRTTGYVDLARQSALPLEERVKALRSARSSADGIPGWKKAEALESIADEYRKLGLTAEGREAVAAAESILVALPDTMPIKAPLLSNCARSYAELGDLDSAARLLETTETLALRVQAIDRPTVYANVASSWAAARNAKNARRLYRKALDDAATLVNARPRALAVVEICRSMGRNQFPLDAESRARLDLLYSGLKDPW